MADQVCSPDCEFDAPHPEHPCGRDTRYPNDVVRQLMADAGCTVRQQEYVVSVLLDLGWVARKDDRMKERTMREAASRFGARLGNWNDRLNATGDRTAEHPRRWHVLDRVAGWLYTRPDR